MKNIAPAVLMSISIVLGLSAGVPPGGFARAEQDVAEQYELKIDGMT